MAHLCGSYRTVKREVSIDNVITKQVQERHQAKKKMYYAFADLESDFEAFVIWMMLLMKMV